MSVFATGTAIGSWPGVSPRQAAEVVVGELGGALSGCVSVDCVGSAEALRCVPSQNGFCADHH